MAAPKTLTQGDRLRIAAEQLLDLADRYDTPSYSLAQRQVLHDETETVAGDVRAVVRGRPAPSASRPPLWISADGLSAGW